MKSRTSILHIDGEWQLTNCLDGVVSWFALAWVAPGLRSQPGTRYNLAKAATQKYEPTLGRRFATSFAIRASDGDASRPTVVPIEAFERAVNQCLS